MIVFDNNTPFGRDEGPVRTCPKRLLKGLAADAWAERDLNKRGKSVREGSNWKPKRVFQKA